MEYMKIYEEWLNNPHIDEDTKKELLSIKDNEKEIQERFYTELEFGTAGLRGKLGAGTNRMNKYIIRKATQGIAETIKNKGQEYMDMGVAIAYDCRHFSPEFAKEAALVLCANNIKAYLFESLRPTPELSFAIRSLNTASGINITASHNPKDYNGYKVYWKEGSQIKSDIADEMMANIKNINDFGSIPTISEEEALSKGLLTMIAKEIDDAYIEGVKRLSLRDAEIDKDIVIVYTPLNGAGNVPVRRVLAERGFKNVHVVKEQELPDPNFTTIEYPNPEDLKAFEYSERLAHEVNADFLIATDPDCDRLAVEVRTSEGKIIPLNGNQTGALLINYILEALSEKGQLPNNGIIVKSIVTGELGTAICNKYGVEMKEVLTGFKNICEIANQLDTTKDKEYIFGYEESIGYVTGTLVRDKDGVSSSMMLAEAAAYYKTKGKTLVDVLNDLYTEFGYYQEKQISLVLEGIEGQKRIARMMEVYRREYLTSIGNSKLVKLADFLTLETTDFTSNEKTSIDMEKTDALKFTFDDGCWYALRPSGTEPKIKLYIYSKASTLEESRNMLKSIEDSVLQKLHSIE